GIRTDSRPPAAPAVPDATGSSIKASVSSQVTGWPETTRSRTHPTPAMGGSATTSLSRRLRLVSVSLVLLLAGGVAVAIRPKRAQATTVSGIKIDDTHPKVKADYGPIPGNNPAAGNVADPTTSDCDTLPTEDLIK